jgi:hypothetical protein
LLGRPPDLPSQPIQPILPMPHSVSMNLAFSLALSPD